MPTHLLTKATGFIYSLLLISLLTACGGLSKNWDMQAYTVSKGDTLYSIAWRYEKDFREIAEWNNISPPYGIYPGQRLIMQPANMDGTLSHGDRPQVLVDSKTGESIGDSPARSNAPQAPSVKLSHRAKEVTVQKRDTLYAIARREGYTHQQIARWNHLKSPYVLKPGQKLRLSPPTSFAKTTKSREASIAKTAGISAERPRARPITKQAKLPTRVSKWQWPAKGRVIKTFRSNDTSRKGIGIRGKSGQTIHAAAAGSVVYSGNGLINYGNLLIIKHSHSFLSAYAYNKKLLVKEGDKVAPGQAIAKMGSPDSNKPQLHFEIRRNGKPVNPLNYLPKS